MKAMRLLPILFLFLATLAFGGPKSPKVEARISEMESNMRAGDYGKGRQIALELEKTADGRVLYTLGFLEAQRRTESGDKKAHKYYLESTKDGFQGAYLSLYFVYLNGRGTKADKSKALSWLEKAVEAKREGDLEGRSPKFLLAEHYIYGDLGPVEKRKALDGFVEIFFDPKFEGTEERVLSIYYIGGMGLEGSEPIHIGVTDEAFDIVLTSAISSPDIKWAKAKIQEFEKAGIWSPNRGDGSNEHLECKKQGLKSWTEGYKSCRIAIAHRQDIAADIARREALANQQLEKAAQIAKEQKDRHETLLFLNLLGALAGAQAPRPPPIPSSSIGGPFGCRLVGDSESGSYSFKSCQYECANGPFTKMVGFKSPCPLQP